MNLVLGGQSAVAGVRILQASQRTKGSIGRSALLFWHISNRQAEGRGYATGGNGGQNGHLFDSNRLVERLETQGFNQQQSEAIVQSVTDVLQESTASILGNIVTKAEQDKTLYMYKVDFAQLKSEIQMMEKTDFSMMKAENERLQGQVNKLKQKLREEITRTQAGVRLDMSLEKGRARDEQAVHEIKIRETDAKIEQEISGLRTQMESIKFSILQYMIGTITGTGALILAYLRMFK
ncbi:Protein fmp32, mitochondrial [Coemansia sp. RSA 1933]|nr:Protein fmp32, mitochondrial [Coemansia sp. RSA 1933]